MLLTNNLTHIMTITRFNHSDVRRVTKPTESTTSARVKPGQPSETLLSFYTEQVDHEKQEVTFLVIKN